MAPPQRPGDRLKGVRLDLWSIALAPLGIGFVVLAQVLDGIALAALVQAQAALIVFGGTLGALFISYSPREVVRALKAAGQTFTAAQDDSDTLTTLLVGISVRAHRRGLLSIEGELNAIADPFLREGLALAVDGTPAEPLREALTIEANARNNDDEAPARVFDAAAGYTPTLGILGAVLGLIKVMEHLSAPGSLGSGIAIAFVATVYGVAAANLVLLPLAARIRERSEVAKRRRDMMIQAICGIQQRLHPRLVSQRLRAFTSNVKRFDEVAMRLGTRGPVGSKVSA